MVPEHAACILNFETYIAHDFSNPERRLFPMRPSGENLIYLNKLAEMTYKFSSLVPNAKREKTPDQVRSPRRQRQPLTNAAGKRLLMTDHNIFCEKKVDEQHISGKRRKYCQSGRSD